MATNFNINPRGYGVMRECRATQRISVTHNKPTGLGALLNPAPWQQNMADANRKISADLGFESWAGNHPSISDRLELLAAHTDTNDNGEFRSGHSIVRTIADETHAMRQKIVADSEIETMCVDNWSAPIVPTRISDNPDAIVWAERAAQSANPAAYIQNNVPAKYRARVVAIATR